MKHEFTRARGPTIGLVIALGAILMQFDAAQSRDFCAVLQRVLATTDFGAQGPLRGFLPEGAVSAQVNPTSGYTVNLESVSKSSSVATKTMRLRNVTAEVADCLSGATFATRSRSASWIDGFLLTWNARTVEVAIVDRQAADYWLIVQVLPPGRRHLRSNANPAWRPPPPPQTLCEALKACARGPQR
jgi:hypothetical protein